MEGDDWNLPILTDDIPQLNHELLITPQLQEIYTKTVIKLRMKSRFFHKRGKIIA